MSNTVLTNVFDIFSDVLDNIITTSGVMSKKDSDLINGEDLKNVTKEELDKTMSYLDKLKDNEYVTLLLGDEYVSALQAELQAKWDMAHEEPKKETISFDVETDRVNKRIASLVDEFLKENNITDEVVGSTLAKASREAYITFANFIYNHK